MLQVVILIPLSAVLCSIGELTTLIKNHNYLV